MLQLLLRCEQYPLPKLAFNIPKRVVRILDGVRAATEAVFKNDKKGRHLSRLRRRARLTGILNIGRLIC
jgi:hypothetical protein